MTYPQHARSALLSSSSLALILVAAVGCSKATGTSPPVAGRGGTSMASGGNSAAGGGASGTGGVAGGATSSTSVGMGGSPAAGGNVAAGGTGAGGFTGSGGATGGDTSPGAGGGGNVAGAAGGTPLPADAAPPPDSLAVGEAGGNRRPAGFLHVEGSKLVDWRGKSVRLTGVNWFGLETNNQEPHGIWVRDYRSMVKQIADLGFNVIRLPWSNEIMRSDAKASDAGSFGKSGPDAYDGTNPINTALAGKSPLEIMDKVIEAAGEFGVEIILDNHSREPDGYMNEQVWYTDKTPETQWIQDWVTLAKRYAGNTTVVGADLDNEPHGSATWGAGVATTDWNSAAERCGNAILAANPDWLIVVEGVEKVSSDGYWWGGNLSGAKSTPIKLTDPSKLMYSAHEYGPEVHEQTWFDAADFPGNMPSVWTPHFAFLMEQNLGHVLIGEFGIKDRSAVSGKAGVWFDTLLAKLAPTYSWTFWCWNPNSGDTEGLLGYDWATPVQWKIDALKPVMAPMIGQ